MKLFLLIIFLLGISRDIFGKGIRRKKNNNEVELSYQDLKNMNISCYPYDSCKQVRSDYRPVLALEDKCSCHSQCWEYGTCCIDSPYRVKPPIKKCFYRRLFKSYYMVHRCPHNTHPDSIWRNHCERELSDTDDILMISPVTSLDTSRTYKNYYCFRCHEKTDKYVSWNLEVESFSAVYSGASVYKVAYNQTLHDWVAILDGSHKSIPVSMSFVFPQNVQGEPMICDAFSGFKVCPREADERVQAKCLAYSAIVYSHSGTFRNVHCALCNGESLHDLTCNEPTFVGGGGGMHGSGEGGVRPGGFMNTLRCMIDINGGKKHEECFETYDKPETCKGDYQFWNHYSKACKDITCLRPGYILKNDRCIIP